MTRVSLKEAYDNKDVVAQIYTIRDIAEGAEDTANNAVSTANTASEHVDALVPQVEVAVQNANNASASAQQSAQTVTGYDTRLTAVEDADTKNVKLDTNQVITGAKTFNVKGDPIIIQAPNIDGNIVPSNNLHSEIDIRDSIGREIAYFIRRHQANGDANVGMVCKHTRLGLSADISAFVTNDGKTYGIAPTPGNSTPSYAIATKGYVESTDGETNNLVHRTADETISGVKDFVSHIKLSNGSWRFDCVFPELDNANPSAVTGYIRIAAGSGSTYEIGRIQYSIRDNGNRYFALYLVDKNGGYHSKVLFEIDNDGNVVV